MTAFTDTDVYQQWLFNSRKRLIDQLHGIICVSLQKIPVSCSLSLEACRLGSLCYSREHVGSCLRRNSSTMKDESIVSAPEVLQLFNIDQ